MKIIFFITLPLWLFGSQILNYNIYNRSDRVDLMLTFDTPFDGKILQQRHTGSILIKLDNVSIESPKIKNLNSKFLNKLTITPIGSQVQILANIPDTTVLKASKTSDSYGLRLRFLKAKDIQKNVSVDVKSSSVNSLPTKQDTILQDNYKIVVFILILGIIIIFWLKRSLNNSINKSSKPSLFKSKSTTTDSNEATIRFQKPLDQHNSVMMLDYADESYLVIVGNNNVVLDKFHDSKPVSQDEFESILDTKESELDSYLKLDNIDKVESDEILQSYKERASV